MQSVFSASPKDTAWFDMVYRSVFCHALLQHEYKGNRAIAMLWGTRLKSLTKQASCIGLTYWR